MHRFSRTADMLADVSRLLAFAAHELRDCACAAAVADDRACSAIDQADMLQRQLDRLRGEQVPELRPSPGPLPAPDDAPTATDVAPEGLPVTVTTWRIPVLTTPAPAADIPPLDAVATPSPVAGARTRRGRGAKKGDAEGSGEGQTLSPDAATDAEAREQVAQVLGDPPEAAPAPAPRDVTADLFGAPVAADGDDFPPL